MIAQRRIRALAREIGRHFEPQRVIVFGSRASGSATTDSDVDLLVVMDFRGLSARMAAKILNRVEPDFPVDLIVRTPQELRRRIALNDRFLADIVRRGKVVYEAAHA